MLSPKSTALNLSVYEEIGRRKGEGGETFGSPQDEWTMEKSQGRTFAAGRVRERKTSGTSETSRKSCTGCENLDIFIFSNEFQPHLLKVICWCHPVKDEC